MEAWLLDYLQRILTARVYDVAVEIAPRARARSSRTGWATRCWLKREDTQPVFSFKLRGAYNKMARLSPERTGPRRHLRVGRATTPRASPSARAASDAGP